MICSSHLYGVSACLVGCRCRYDGLDKRNIFFMRVMLASVIPVCPEVFGGLSVPRYPCSITRGNGFDVLDGNAKVKDCYGKDVTNSFLQGACHVYQVFVDKGISKCFLKAGSPSCGFCLFPEETLSGEKSIDGSVEIIGVTAALLFRRGINIMVVP